MRSIRSEGPPCAPYAPADTPTVLADLLAEPSLARGVVHHAVLPARDAAYGDVPGLAGPADRGGPGRPRASSGRTPTRPRRIEAVHAGEDVVVVTPTASGKTLCYTLPILQAHRRRPGGAGAAACSRPRRSARTRSTEFGELAAAAGLPISASTYDGDTPAPIRSAIRSAGQVVVTNPDMLHSAILPHHTKWFQLFEQLKVIVIDELHTYRGVFGGHVANVLRRLLRICAHYGSHPVIVCCSATIGNPAELADDADRAPGPAHRPQRRPGRRAARPAGRPAAPGCRRPAPAGRP